MKLAVAPGSQSWRVTVAGVIVFPPLMAFVGIWLAFMVMPYVTAWELPAAALDALPWIGTGLGAALGLSMAFSKQVRRMVWYVFGAVLLGFFLWLVLCFLVGLGVVAVVGEERFPQVMDSIGAIIAWIATLLVLAMIGVGAYAILHDNGAALLARLRSRLRKAN